MVQETLSRSTQVKLPFGVFSHCVPDRRMDGRQTDGRTDRVTYRVACTRLKMNLMGPWTNVK